MGRLLFATGALALMTMSAEAATMKATYTGSVYDGVDYYENVFDTGSTSLDGFEYILTVVYDTALGARSTIEDAADRLYGGSLYGLVSPIVSVTLEINGVEVALNATRAGFAFLVAGGPSSTFAKHEASGTTSNGTIDVTTSFFQETTWNTGTSIDLEVSKTLTDSLVDNYGYFELSAFDTSTSSYAAHAKGYMTVESLKITQYDEPAAVPLPATAGLLVAALGGLGALVRRRRQA
jgi:hypothetical protein